MVPQYDGREDEGDGRGGEEDGRAVSDRKSLDGLEYTEKEGSAHHSLGTESPPGGEVRGAEEGDLVPPGERQHAQALAQTADQQHLPGAHQDVKTSELDPNITATERET